MKRINFNIKDRKLLYGVLSIVLVCIFTLSIAYAALSAVLTINGNAEVVSSTWDVYLANVHVKDGSVDGGLPSIVNSTTASFSTTLSKPGDYYEFFIDVVNNGSIDAMIESIMKTPTLSTAQEKYINYIIEYENGESLNEVRERELNALNYILNNSKSDKIAIVFHSTAMMTLLKTWCEVSYESDYYFKGNKFFDGKWNYCETFKLKFDDDNNLISIKNLR